MPRKIKNKTTKQLNNVKNKTKQLQQKVNKLNNKITNTIKAPNKKFIPAANTKTLNKDFRILYQDGTTVKVTGRDLVYAIPDSLAQQNLTDIITVIPANPCYWLGTRISALAQGYQNYRPLSMKFSYIPQCAVTQQGNVIAGTLWNQAPSNDNLQQSLRTSNGGQLSQCYKSFTSVVRLKSNLQYNLYKTAGQFDQESNPFIFMSIAVGCKNSNNQNIIPGYYYVTWAFLLKNPIGNTNLFYNSGIIKYANVDKDYENKTIVFLTPGDEEIQRGAILQLEDDEEDQMTAYYNGSIYDMNEDDLVWYFANSTIQQTNTLQRSIKQTLMYQYTTTGAESPGLDTSCLIFEPKYNPEVYEIWFPAMENARADTIQVHNMIGNNVIDRTQTLYFWNDLYFEMVPLPIINPGTFIALKDNPGTYNKVLAYQIPKDQCELTEYTRDYKPKQQRLRKRGKRALIDVNASTKQQKTRPLEAEESLKDLFNQDKESEGKETQAMKCTLEGKKGNVEADAYKIPKQASRIDKYLNLNKDSTNKRSISAKAKMKRIDEEFENEITDFS
jgi:hypothetical protein